MIQQKFFNWATSGLDWEAPPYEQCSPNLQQILGWLIADYGGYSLGCHADRTIRQGTAISSHAYGAALDWRYTPVPVGSVNVTRQTIEQSLLPYLIAHSAELHLDAIHDYYGDRIWRAGRTSNLNDAYSAWWKKQYGAGAGMGETWATYLHLETHRDGWNDDTPVNVRLSPPAGPPDASHIATPSGTPTFGPGATDATTSGRVTTLQKIMGKAYPTTGVMDVVTVDELRRLQGIGGLVQDGWYGPKTEAVFKIWRGH